MRRFLFLTSLGLLHCCLSERTCRLFAVLDGHGGRQAAAFVKEALPSELASQLLLLQQEKARKASGAEDSSTASIPLDTSDGEDGSMGDSATGWLTDRDMKQVSFQPQPRRRTRGQRAPVTSVFVHPRVHGPAGGERATQPCVCVCVPGRMCLSPAREPIVRRCAHTRRCFCPWRVPSSERGDTEFQKGDSSRQARRARELALRGGWFRGASAETCGMSSERVGRTWIFDFLISRGKDAFADNGRERVFSVLCYALFSGDLRSLSES